MAGRAATGFEQVEETRFLLNQPFPNGASLKRLTFFLTDVRRPALPTLSHSPAACRLAEPLTPCGSCMRPLRAASG